MSVDKIASFDSLCFATASDYEAIEIARRLRAYGIEPTADKQANKAKLHEIELLKVKSNNEPTGKFLTISYSQEQEIITKKKENLYGSVKNYKKEKGNKDFLKEDEILGRQILAIIELKKREEQDLKKTKEINKKTSVSSKKQKINQRAVYTPKISVMPEINSGEKNMSIKNEVQN